MHFTVTVAGLSGLGSDTIFYATDLPLITSVSGCSDDGNATKDCDTRGGDFVTLRGVNFNGNLRVIISGQAATVDVRPIVTFGLCMSAIDASPDGTECVVTTPPGTGLNQPIQMSSNGLYGTTADLLSYAAPTILQIVGCTAVQVGPKDRSAAHGTCSSESYCIASRAVQFWTSNSVPCTIQSDDSPNQGTSQSYSYLEAVHPTICRMVGAAIGEEVAGSFP